MSSQKSIRSPFLKGLQTSKGSILLSVMVLSMAMAMVVASALQWGLAERKTDEQYRLKLNADSAVEALLETSIAEVISQWKNEPVIVGTPVLKVPAYFTPFFDSASSTLTAVENWAEPISAFSWLYINPDEPSFRFDEQRGENLLAASINLYGKVQISSSSKKTITRCAKQVLQLRSIPLFTHAVFYNMDLEYYPELRMDIYGPVHANGNIYGASRSDLYFHSAVTTAKDYFHGLAPGNPVSVPVGDVWFSNGQGTFLSDNAGSGSFYDSNMENWADVASQRWLGNLQTQAHGISALNPVGYDTYVRDNPNTAAVDDALNYAYGLIEPNLKVQNRINHPDYKGAKEKEKFAYKSGLIIRVHEKVEPTSQKPFYKLADGYYVTFHKLQRTDTNNPNSTPVTDSSGALKEVDIEVNSDFVKNFLALDPYKENKGTPTSGFWDARRQMGLNILELDMTLLRKAVDNTYLLYAGDSQSVWQSNYSPKTDYNGVVYVEFPINEAISGRPDGVVVSSDGYGLLVTNGGVVPNPTYNSDNRTNGFTLATNNALYIKGDFNADGVMLTGSATAPDSIFKPEPPVALAADSITLLSENWNPANSKAASPTSRKAENTEINAALIQGIVPSGINSGLSSSGGNENFIRLLEDWSGKTLRSRGSQIALFESEIGSQPHRYDYYKAPTRDWGYYSEFAKGKFPPGTPYLRTFKRMAFHFITEAQYNSAAHTETSTSTSTSDSDKPWWWWLLF